MQVVDYLLTQDCQPQDQLYDAGSSQESEIDRFVLAPQGL